jgi:hypothetical protein
MILDLLSSPVVIAAGPTDRPTSDLLWAESSVQAEHLILHGREFLSGRGKDPGPLWTSSFHQAIDFASVLESSERDGIPLIVLRPGVADHHEIGGSPEALARLRARRSESLTVVVPQRAASIGERRFLGWWLIDPRNGFVMDELENGGHQTGTESGVTNTQSRGQTEVIEKGWLRKAWDWSVRNGRKVACILMAPAIILGGVQSATGNPSEIGEGEQQIVDALEGIAKKRKQGSAGDPGETGECFEE